MKTIFGITAVTMGFVVNAFAFQPQFEIDYTNYAWGYDNRGCVVDVEGNVYKYRYGHSSDGKGIVAAGKMSASDFATAKDLAEKARSGKYTEKHAAADAGTQVWLAYAHGQQVKLRTTGDFEGKNNAPETDQLLTLLDAACPN